MKFNPPPNWPTPPEGFVPEPGWTPDPTLPAPPPGWQLWVEDDVLLPGETTEATRHYKQATTSFLVGVGFFLAGAISTIVTANSTTGIYWWGGMIVGVIGLVRAFTEYRTARKDGAPNLTGLTLWLDKWFGWIPLFDYQLQNRPNNLTDFTAGIILAIMILPIISSISREVFGQVPRDQVEAALALGATRWEMIRTSVVPFGRSGVVSASILGLGRALGETLAVTIVLSTVYGISWHITQSGGVTFAMNIALKYGEAGTVGTNALIASGLCLFIITLAVNFSAQLIIRRRKGA